MREGKGIRTDEEILARVEALEDADYFGFVRGDLISYLSFDAAKPSLKDGVTAEQWTPLPRDRDSLLAQMLDYMPFAWGKANDCRGLSAGRSINHMQAWLWMLGEDRAAEWIDDYSLYGKPQLRAICEKFGWDWKQWDNDCWTRNEGSSEFRANEVPALNLPWADASRAPDGV